MMERGNGIKGANGISVAMCTYNGERFLEEQLRSIAGQTTLPSELVICDDCSVDSTVEIVKKFAQSAPFEVNLIENAENIGATKKGITRNFEKAVGLCKGQFIALCDQDDVWFPEKLSRLAEPLEGDPQLGGVFSDAQLIDQHSRPTGVRLRETTGFSVNEQTKLQRGESLPVLLAMTKVYGCTLMFRARLLEKMLPVPPSWWLDAWLACMIAVHSRLGFISDPLFFYRIHPSQQVGAERPSLSGRIQRWRRPARDYFEEAQPQLMELHERLQAQQEPNAQPHLEYIHGRLALLRLRAGLPANRMMRLIKVLPAVGNYHRYFNGWRSIIKDLTA